MLQIYLKAENMKYKRSLFQKLVIVIPAVLILTSMVFMYIGMGLGGFSSVMVCNWSMPIAALSVVFMCHLVNNKEKKHQYRTLYSLPIDLKKTFVSKTILIAGNLLVISLVLAIVTIICECILSGFVNAVRLAGYHILGYCLLWVSLLWQIPFCLFLEQKTGFVASMIINLFASAASGLFLYLTPLFWIFPYSWPARFMVTVFGVLTNGLLAEPGSRLILNRGESLLLVLLSLFAAFALTAFCSRWYERQVYRK